MNTIYKVYFIITLKDSTSYTIKTIKVFNHSGGQQDLFTIKAGIELYLETSDFNSDTLDATCHFFLTNSTVISSMKIYLKDTKIMLLGSMSNADNSTDIRTFYNLSDYRTLNCVINCTPY
jgi:nicotinic acid mononucleotide adenylyltransferase